jgi:hypothetical protein
MNNNGIKVYQGFQQKTFNKASGFSNFIHSPRGIGYYENNKMYSLSVDYRMPLLYPYASLGKLLYIKRVKSSFFYDYAWISAPALNNDHVYIPNIYEFQLNSIGIELTADLHAFRFFAPVECGVRTIYLPETKNVAFDLLIAVNFNGF